MIPDPLGGDRPAHILIVDDDPRNRALIGAMLAPEGVHIQTAVSGAEALALVAADAPDLILLDVMMPDIDGYQVAAALKADGATRAIPIIMLSALDDRRTRLLGLEAGAEDFLVKPVQRAELTVRVRNLLRLKAYVDFHDSYSRTLEDEMDVRASALIESEARFRQLAETLDQVFLLVDPTISVVYYVNPAYESLSGRSCASLYAAPSSWWASIHPDDLDDLIGTVMPEGHLVPCDVDFRLLRSDGSERSVRARGRRVHTGPGGMERFAIIIDDVTDRLALETRLRQAHKLDAIGQLASGIAHDFNNLVTVILGFAQMMVTDATLGAQHREDLDEIIKAGKRAAGLTQQLLAFSRQQVLASTPLDMNDVVRGMTGMLGRLIGEHITIAVALDPDLSRAFADQGQIEQVVMNLVVNARDAMPAGGTVTLTTADRDLTTTTFRNESVVPGPYVMLSIADTGKGINLETQQRIFEPFFTTKTSGRGTGLGLSTTYGIVKQSKGYIWVDSQVGVGTTFTVYLPRIETAPVNATALEQLAAHTAHTSETILLVEDETNVRRLVRRVLTNDGYHVVEASSGDDAETAFINHVGKIHLLLTDVIMPGCGGPELLQRLRVHSPSLRVLFMSGYIGSTVVLAEVVDNGAGFIQKPFTAEEMVRQVRAALDR